MVWVLVLVGHFADYLDYLKDVGPLCSMLKVLLLVDHPLTIWTTSEMGLCTSMP